MPATSQDQKFFMITLCRDKENGFMAGIYDRFNLYYFTFFPESRQFFRSFLELSPEVSNRQTQRSYFRIIEWVFSYSIWGHYCVCPKRWFNHGLLSGQKSGRFSVLLSFIWARVWPHEQDHSGTNKVVWWKKKDNPCWAKPKINHIQIQRTDFNFFNPFPLGVPLLVWISIWITIRTWLVYKLRKICSNFDPWAAFLILRNPFCYASSFKLWRNLCQTVTSFVNPEINHLES